MKLSDVEVKMLRKLQREDEHWLKWGRWAFLFAGLFVSVSSVLLLVVVSKYLGDPVTGWVFQVHIIQLYCAGIGGAFMLGKSIFHWHGNPKNVLLLRVLENSLNCEQKPSGEQDI